MTTPPINVYRCGRCNRPFAAGEERTHSVWSGLSYCWGITACAKRAKSFLDRPSLTWLPSAKRN